MENSRWNRLNTRAMVSSAMFFSFLWPPPTGIALHLTESTSFQSVRHFLMAVHNMSALLFLTAVSFHLGLNWRAMAQYLVSKVADYQTFRKGAVIPPLL
ncbi:MAG: DUF4405 domain-containing protein [candidate division NC10 bacterium]|nr:DUF4405 domain-containing protein [candidate division NC10 bacterium]